MQRARTCYVLPLHGWLLTVRPVPATISVIGMRQSTKTLPAHVLAQTRSNQSGIKKRTDGGGEAPSTGTSANDSRGWICPAPAGNSSTACVPRGPMAIRHGRISRWTSSTEPWRSRKTRSSGYRTKHVWIELHGTSNSPAPGGRRRRNCSPISRDRNRSAISSRSTTVWPVRRLVIRHERSIRSCATG